MSDKELEKRLETYQQLAKENPNVDVNMLMASALAQESQKIHSAKSYKWPYLIALGVPPLGLLFALKYYLSGDEDDRTAANICVLLTIVAVLIFYAFSKALLSGSGASLEQIQQIKTKDILELTK